MYNSLIKLMVIAALIELGISMSDFRSCHSRQCLVILEKKSREILRIDWQPVSIFPEEAKKFR